jgi:hypothetical protein
MIWLQLLCMIGLLGYVSYLVWVNRADNIDRLEEEKLLLRERFNTWVTKDFDKARKGSSDETHRWLFCFDGENTDTFDCGCYLIGKEEITCDCVCHKRLDEIVEFF